MNGNLSTGLPLTLTLSPQAGRGDDRDRRLSLLPVYGEKVADRPDEGPVSSRLAPSFSGEAHAPHF
jgi:hypothetical protein